VLRVTVVALSFGHTPQPRSSTRWSRSLVSTGATSLRLPCLSYWQSRQALAGNTCYGLPLLIARGGRTVWWYLWPASLYAANGYLRLLTLPTEGHGDQVPQTGLCLLVCLGAVITLPWNARQLGSSRTRQERKMDPVGSGSVIGI